MAQTALRLRLVEAPSTGYAREAWYSHIVETAPDEIGPTELHVLGELLRQVHDAEGWAEASYEKLAKRTRFAVKTIRNAARTLAEHGLIQPELIRGEGRDRLRYHFPAMHAFLAERKARRDGGRSDHGTRPKPTLVSEGENLAPLKEPDSEPSAHAREAWSLEEVKRRLRSKAPKPLAEAVEASVPELHGQTLAVWMPPTLEPVLRAAEGTLRSILREHCGVGLYLERANRRPRAGA